MDDYTSQFTTSETPFIAWVTVTSRRYEDTQLSAQLPCIPFINDRLFRAVWFSYIRLIQLDTDMICPTCGPNPEAVIFDGVTLAFNRKNLRNSLNPPTTLHQNSIRKDAVRQVAGLQCIVDYKIRHALRDVLKGPRLLLSLLPNIDGLNLDSDAPTESDDTDDETQAPGRTKKSRIKKSKAMHARIRKIPTLLQGLRKIDQHLANLFDRCYGPAAVMSNLNTPTIYQKLFLQVRPSILLCVYI